MIKKINFGKKEINSIMSKKQFDKIVILFINLYFLIDYVK